MSHKLEKMPQIDILAFPSAVLTVVLVFNFFYFIVYLFLAPSIFSLSEGERLFDKVEPSKISNSNNNFRQPTKVLRPYELGLLGFVSVSSDDLVLLINAFVLVLILRPLAKNYFQGVRAEKEKATVDRFNSFASKVPAEVAVSELKNEMKNYVSDITQVANAIDQRWVIARDILLVRPLVSALNIAAKTVLEKQTTYVTAQRRGRLYDYYLSVRRPSINRL